ncbi:osmotically inducible protein C [Longimycelium tulufanense]|uniref:Osmotically inducible protein C n=1 Tax=Longimycelium tulufanense TaxID=907463 RepID=A0A8J3CGA9_9PSEU|nr:OsmC family protein [Longimycelium tulufanense]GGM56575.1 osmotically inducible protein C [Longimycelium tulufanense]
MNPSPVEVHRESSGFFVATNARGARIRIGRVADGADFSPVELLLAALGACAGLSAEGVVGRTVGEEAPMAVHVAGTKDKPTNRLDTIRMAFDVDLSTLDDDERATLAIKIVRAVERGCTVSRTVEPGTSVELAPLPGGPGSAGEPRS